VPSEHSQRSARLRTVNGGISGRGSPSVVPLFDAAIMPDPAVSASDRVEDTEKGQVASSVAALASLCVALALIGCADRELLCRPFRLSNLS